ncbi:MAG: hypothetical protein PVG30_01415 [Gammaproteobacteria bacterium]|jgi:hypothetical protein
MDNIFVLNPSVTTLDLKDAINERFMKAKSIIACLMLQDVNYNEPNYSVIYNAIWTISDFLDEIEYFEDKIKEREK